jgi:hypothetical protein
MNKILSTLVIISPLVAIALANPALAGESKPKNYVGVTLQSTSGLTLYGVQGRVGVADNISVRPFVTFGSRTDRQNILGTPVSVNTSVSYYGASLTYDLSLPDSPLNAYAGLGYVGASATVSGSTGNTSLGSVSGADSGTYVEVGADYQIGGNIILNANYKTNSSVFGITAGYSF